VIRFVFAAALTLVPPVDGPIARPFQPPAKPWGPGHRGVDYRVPPGTPVRAAADGVVGFAGGVAGGLHVAVDHVGSLRTSYAYLARVDVSRGQHLRQGDVVGLSGGTGPGHGRDVVHFGVRREGRYVDPVALVPIAPLGVRLAPLDAGPPPPCWPEGDPAGGGYTDPSTRPPGREFTRPHPIGDRGPRDRASSGRRPNRGKKENVAWPLSR
jgi:murein DD-endopeptidase MepM/ murein hydrolase activator NlpD